MVVRNVEMFTAKKIFILSLIFSLKVLAQGNMFGTAIWSCSQFKNQPAISVNGNVEAILTDGTTTYIGGTFTQVQGVDRRNLAALDRAGNVLPFNPRMSSTVNALALSGTTLYAAGNFNQVGSDWVDGRGVAINSDGVFHP
jgi:hypothetical protein